MGIYNVIMKTLGIQREPRITHVPAELERYQFWDICYDEESNKFVVEPIAELMRKKKSFVIDSGKLEIRNANHLAVEAMLVSGSRGHYEVARIEGSLVVQYHNEYSSKRERSNKQQMY